MASRTPFRTMRFAFVILALISFSALVSAACEACVPGNTLCRNSNPYQCDWISILCTRYDQLDTCASNEYCYDPWDPTVGAQCWACNSPCSSGQKACDGTTGYKTCVADTGERSKCYKWSAVTSCSSGQYCSGGSCVSCSNDCSSGQKRCSGSGYQTCSQDSNKCWKWGSTQSCGSGYTCSGSGSCVVQCSNQCSNGEKRCNGNGMQTCATDSNGCRIWGSTSNCASDEKCSGGSCVKKCLPTNCRWSSTATIDEGGTATLKADFVGCGGKNVDVSVYDSDWPVEDPDFAFSFPWTVNGDGAQTKAWTAQWTDDNDGSDIAPEYFFRIDTIDGSCSTGQETWNTLWLRKVCSNPCSEGQKACDGNGYRTCKKDKYGCAYWEKTADCASDQKCQDGGCVQKSCQELGYYDWCVLLTNTECHNNNPFECKAISLTQWCYVKTGTCGNDEVCRDPLSPLEGARCEKTCVNECTAGQTRCSADGKGYRTCKAEFGECWKWGTDSASCTAEQKCESGRCVAKTCKEMGYYDSCVLIGNTVCKENGPYKCRMITETTWCLEKQAICAANETCIDPLGPQEGAHCEPQGAGCRVLSADWSAGNASDGDSVTMRVAASGCDGKTVNMSVWEDDALLNPDDYIGSKTATVVNGSASAAWTAAWQKDCIADLCGNPEYYFDAKIGDASLRSGTLDVTPKVLNTEDAGELLRANPPSGDCEGYDNVSYGCVEKMNSFGANYAEEGQEDYFWKGMEIAWITSCAGCLGGLCGMGVGYLACPESFGAGCAFGYYSSIVALGACDLCIGGGDIGLALGYLKIETVSALRATGITSAIASERTALENGGGEIISEGVSATGARVVSKNKDGFVTEVLTVISKAGDSIKRYYRTFRYGDLDAEAEEYAMRYILDRPGTSFGGAAKDALMSIYRLQKRTGIVVEFENEAAAADTLRFVDKNAYETMSAIMEKTGIDGSGLKLRFKGTVLSSEGKEIMGRTAVAADGTRAIELSTGYLKDAIRSGELSESDVGFILIHSTLSHEASHPFIDAMIAKAGSKYPEMEFASFVEYLVDMKKLGIDPDAMAAVRMEIDRGVVNSQTVMNEGAYGYAVERAKAIKAGREQFVNDWDSVFLNKLKQEGYANPGGKLSNVIQTTNRIMSVGDELLSGGQAAGSDWISSRLAIVHADMIAIIGWWNDIDGPDKGCICAAVMDPVCGKDGKTYDNECEAECAGTTLSYKGVCTPKCMNECSTAGQKVCSGSTVKTCVKDNEGCMRWDTWADCRFDETCSSGSCVKTCADQCKTGQKRCSGSGYQACDTLQNGCWRWGAITACGSAETCEDGKCIARSCNEMGYDGFCMTPGNTACRNGNPYNCRIVSTNRWCWEKLDSCGGDETCKDPSGSAGAYCAKKPSDPATVTIDSKPECYDKCTEGETQCRENDIVSCARNSEGCLDWNKVSSCAQDEGCRNAACMKKCTIWNGRPICPVGERCDNNVCVPAD